MASGNFTTGSMTPSITQLAACGSTSNVVSGGHQFEESEKMATQYLTPRGQTRALRTHCLSEVMAATGDEKARFNRAVRDGAVAYLDTFIGRRRIVSVNTDWWYHDEDGRGWCGCNDYDWAALLRQAGVARNRLFGGA